jgi:hypothetical protein
MKVDMAGNIWATGPGGLTIIVARKARCWDS